MPRKKQKEQPPKTEVPFRTTPFAALKGVVVDTRPPAPEPVISQPKTTPPEQSSDDLFLQAMSGVRRLDATPAAQKITTDKGSRLRDVPVTPATKTLPRDEVVARKTFLKEVERLQLDVRFEDHLPEDDELRPLTGNRLRQLKRGIIQLDRQLDLHGLTREEAVESLSPFLQAARNAGEKAVLIITGKGTHSAEGPVLQQVVAAWLRDQGRELIAEYAPAPRELGGSGAYVVFLRPLDKITQE